MLHKIPDGRHFVLAPTFGHVDVAIKTQSDSQARFIEVTIGGDSILFFCDTDDKIQNIGPRDFQALRNALSALATLADRFNA